MDLASDCAPGAQIQNLSKKLETSGVIKDASALVQARSTGVSDVAYL
jgi:hypothetical protein